MCNLRNRFKEFRRSRVKRKLCLTTADDNTESQITDSAEPVLKPPHVPVGVQVTPPPLNPGNIECCFLLLY